MKKLTRFIITGIALMLSLSLCACSRLPIIGGNTATNAGKSVSGILNGPDNAFKEIRVFKIGDHTYYDTTFFVDRNADKETQKAVLAQMKATDKSLNHDLYIYGCNYSRDSKDVRLYGYDYVDGVIMIDVYYCVNCPGGVAGDWERGDYTVTQQPVDKDGLVDPKETEKYVYDLCEQHKSAMFFGSNDGPIQGTYRLMAHQDGTLYYEFTINEYSRVEIDAHTGEVIMQNYWNGVYVD